MRYQQVYNKIWYDEKFVTLSEKAKFLFLYLLTCHHNNALGIFVLPKGYICGDLDWSMEKLHEPFQELLDKRLILYDEKVKVICIKNHLKYNPIENPNQVMSALKILEHLPRTPLPYAEVIKHIDKPFHEPLREQLQNQFGKPLHEAEIDHEKGLPKGLPEGLPEGLPKGLPEGLPEGLPKPEPETETETVTETETNTSTRSLEYYNNIYAIGSCKGGGRAASSPPNSPREEEKNQRPQKNGKVPAKEIQDIWNRILVSSGSSPPVPPVKKISRKTNRYKHLKARWKEHPNLDEWKELVQKIAASDFLKGHNSKNWVVNFDWVLKSEGNFLKVIEGNYDNNKSKSIFEIDF